MQCQQQTQLNKYIVHFANKYAYFTTAVIAESESQAYDLCMKMKSLELRKQAREEYACAKSIHQKGQEKPRYQDNIYHIERISEVAEDDEWEDHWVGDVIDSGGNG